MTMTSTNRIRKAARPHPKPGQVFREKREGFEQRTIKITSLFPNTAGAVVLTGADGKPPAKLRNTMLTFSTLRKHYILVEVPPAKAEDGE